MHLLCLFLFITLPSLGWNRERVPLKARAPLICRMCHTEEKRFFSREQPQIQKTIRESYPLSKKDSVTCKTRQWLLRKMHHCVTLYYFHNGFCSKKVPQKLDERVKMNHSTERQGWHTFGGSECWFTWQKDYRICKLDFGLKQKISSNRSLWFFCSARWSSQMNTTFMIFRKAKGKAKCKCHMTSQHPH